MIDHNQMKERDIVIDIDNCKDSSTMEESRSSDEVADGGLGERSKKGGVSVSPDSGERNKKEKRLSVSAKKAPKPPRPPRGLSLDAADQKLIKEFSELLMIKRARIERMKALKKTKAAKASSASSSSSGNFLAMLFTLLFCVVIIFQGCHPPKIWPINSSPKSDVATEDKVIASHGQRDFSTGSLHMSSEVGSPNLVDQAPSYDTRDGEKATH